MALVKRKRVCLYRDRMEELSLGRSTRGSSSEVPPDRENLAVEPGEIRRPALGFVGMIERDSDRGKWVCRVCPNAITPTNNYDGLCRSCWETLVLEEDGEVEHLV
jgi:hypothetical protein